jgi:hypothetical protein
MKPTGWKRAHSGCNAYASASDIHKSSIFNSPINRDLGLAPVGLSGLGITSKYLAATAAQAVIFFVTQNI